MRRWVALVALALTSGACGSASTVIGDPAAGTSRTTVVAEVTHTPVYATVQYRPNPVDVADPAFEYLDTAGSSLVRGAWYDASTGYMVIGINGTYYHYCEMPISAWIDFLGASSFGSHYNAAIKGRYDCRVGLVPDY